MELINVYIHSGYGDYRIDCKIDELKALYKAGRSIENSLNSLNSMRYYNQPEYVEVRKTFNQVSFEIYNLRKLIVRDIMELYFN